MSRLIYVYAMLLLTLAACNLQTTTPVPSATAADAPTNQPTRTTIPEQIAQPTPLPIQLTTVNDPNAPTMPPLGITATVQPVGQQEPTTTPQVVPTQSLPTMTDTPQPEAIVFPDEYPDRKVVTVRSGVTLVVDYEVVINNPGRGMVFLVVRDPIGADVARVRFTESETGELDIQTETGGEYEILVAIENLSGRYSTSYSTR